MSKVSIKYSEKKWASTLCLPAGIVLIRYLRTPWTFTWSNSHLTSTDIFGWFPGPVRLIQKPACSACFFSRNSVFFSQQFSQNSIFQVVSAKFQQAEQGYGTLTCVLMKESTNFLSLENSNNALRCKSTSRIKKFKFRMTSYTINNMIQPLLLFQHI